LPSRARFRARGNPNQNILTTAYAILRHNGVDLGKRDDIGSLNLRDG
jgi:hypothetical protein